MVLISSNLSILHNNDYSLESENNSVSCVGSISIAEEDTFVKIREVG